MDSDLKQQIKGKITQGLKPAKISRIGFKEDEDHDGDPVLRIQIVINDSDDAFDTVKFLKLTTDLRKLLADTPTYPVLTLMTDEEASSDAA